LLQVISTNYAGDYDNDSDGIHDDDYDDDCNGCGDDNDNEKDVMSNPRSNWLMSDQ